MCYCCFHFLLTEAKSSAVLYPPLLMSLTIFIQTLPFSLFSPSIVPSRTVISFSSHNKSHPISLLQYKIQKRSVFIFSGYSHFVPHSTYSFICPHQKPLPYSYLTITIVHVSHPCNNTLHTLQFYFAKKCHINFFIYMWYL